LRHSRECHYDRFNWVDSFGEAQFVGMEALLEAGATVGGRDDLLKSTALGWACRWGRVRVASLMLKHGADPVEPDVEPWARPRVWAEKQGHAEIIELLRKYGG
jgi:ankyrin repeat protein